MLLNDVKESKKIGVESEQKIPLVNGERNEDECKLGLDVKLFSMRNISPKRIF